MGSIYKAKVNHLNNPIGYDFKKTVFSWKVDNCFNDKQKFARIIVSQDEKFENIIHDTGDAELDSLATKISLDLKPCTRYYWKVIVTTVKEEVMESDVQFFETAKMEEPWSGKWISCDSNEKRHPVFSREIISSKEVVNARLYVCGLGLYEVYFTALNEDKIERIGNEYLTPYCNNYHRWLQYQTYDITDQMKKNGTISILLGNGWFKGRFGLNHSSPDGFYGNEWKLIAEVHLEYTDGTKRVIATDENWLVSRSKIIFSNIYDGEHRNDLLEDCESVAAFCVAAPKGKLMERLSLPVKIQKEIKAKELIITPKKEKVFDIGQEITGIFRLHVKAEKGSRIHIQTGEVLQEGCFYNDNLRSAKSEYVYISDGKEKEIMPHFTFYGYRYVKVSGIEDLSCDDFTALALYSDFDEVGTLQTGNELVNQLISNVRWGMRDNFLDVPTDCPQRDERMGWTGDAQVFSATASYLTDTYAFYRKYLFDMYQEQLDMNGMVPETIPSCGSVKCSSAWGDAACIIPWNMYLFSGDISILEDQLNSMKDWVEYIRKVDGENHGWRNVFHYGDWLALDRPGARENNVYGATPEAYVADIYYAVSAQITAKALELCKKTEEARQYHELADRQWQVVREEYFTASGRCAVNTQTGLLLALKHHLSKDENKIVEMLKQLLRSSGFKLNTGFIGTPLLCDILTEHGMEETAYHLLLNEEYPGWLHEVKLGATTVWERWNSLDEDGKISGTGMNSLNHYSYGAIVEWLFRHVAGIDISETFPGAREIRIAPKLNAALQYVSATYDSASGKYECHWKILDDDLINLKVVVPFGGSAKVILPNGSALVYEDQNNPLFDCVKQGVCHVGPGVYELTYKSDRPMKKTYSCDSSMEELLKNPKIKAFLSGLMEVDMIPDSAYAMSLRMLANTFAGGAPEEEFQMLDRKLAEF